MWHPVNSRALGFVLALCLILITVLLMSKWHDRSDLLFYSIAFVLGPLGEAFAVHFRAWEYAKPLYLIPVWLPFLWGIFGLFLKKLCETLNSAIGDNRPPA